MLLLLLLLLAPTLTLSLLLSGSPSSYTKYPPWSSTPSSVLSLEFSTIHPSSLLLYTDTSGQEEFFELKLAEGVLRLRYNSGSGANLIQVGRSLNDGLWHRVEIKRNQTITLLTLDDFVSQFKYSKYSNSFTGSVYVGGLPPYYNDKLGLLSLPSVVFEPRLRGSVRNVVYSSIDGVQRGQEAVEWGGLLSTHPSSAACDRHDPCLHGGYCLSTDSGPVCDCKHLDWEGEHCEREKPPASAHFSSTNILLLHNVKPLISLHDEVQFLFKTRVGHGLLFYTGDGLDYLALLLRDGKLILSVNLGGGPLETRLHPDHLNVDDGQWHSVRVSRRVQEITASLDSLYHDHWTLAGQYTMLSSTLVTVGGYMNQIPGLGVHLSNYTGCMRKLDFSADTLRLGLLELARSRHHLIQSVGHTEFECRELETQPETGSQGPAITFTEAGAVLTTPLPYQQQQQQLIIKLQFRTLSSSSSLFHTQGFQLEIRSSKLNLLIGGLRIESHQFIADGEWHSLILILGLSSGSLTVDGVKSEFNVPYSPGAVGLLHIGSGASSEGFTGCLRDLQISGHAVDLVSLARGQDSATIRPHCSTPPPAQCTSTPCSHSAPCSPAWTRPVCSCLGTGHTGSKCSLPSTTYVFNGTSFAQLKLKQEPLTRVSLEFKTQRPTGLLLDLRSDTGDYLLLMLEFSRLKAVYSNNGREKTIATPAHNLNDGNLHSLQVKLDESSLELRVDAGQFARTTVNSNFHVATAQLGRNGQQLAYEGELSSVHVNSMNLLDSLRSGILDSSTTAAYKQNPPRKQVGFRTATHVGLQQLRAYSSLDLSMLVKTTGENGLIFYNGGKSDYIQLEIKNGALHLQLDLGDGAINVKNPVRINDGVWHEIRVARARFRHAISVDGRVEVVEEQGENEHLDLNGLLYFGGLPRNKREHSNFIGCLASLVLNGDEVDLRLDAVVRGEIGECGGATCTPSPCLHNGVCSQTIDSTLCDCSETSFRGLTCSDPGILHSFKGNMLLYKAPPPQPDSRVDSIAFLIKPENGEGTLVYLNSQTTDDFILLELRDWSVKAVWNVGSGNRSLEGPPLRKDESRVVLFKRSGADGQLYYDGAVVDRVGRGPPSTSIFNRQNELHIGGVYNHRSVLAPFQGSMGGLVLNGVEVFGLLEKAHPSIRRIGGDEEEQMQKAPPSHNPTSLIKDEIISSSLGPCAPDDEDQCLPEPSSGDDLITPVYIPPPTVGTTRRPTTVYYNGGCMGDDEDECLEGSGVPPRVTTEEGRRTTEEATTTTTQGTSTTTTKVTTTTTTQGSTPSWTPRQETPRTTTSTTIKPPPPFLPPPTPTVHFIDSRVFDFPTSSPRPPTGLDTTRILHTAESSDSTLVIVIIIALLMIIIVSILIIFFMCKRGDDPIYKVEPPQQQQAVQVQSRQGGQRSKGVKEWYV